MIGPRLAALAALAYSAAFARSGGIAAQSPSLAIEHVTVIPMTSDTALGDYTVLVEGDRIVWLGPSREARVPRGAQRVDGRCGYLIPGLADMHVHVTGVTDLVALVEAGVTTVRNMRGAPEHLAWRDSVANGTLVGPTIFTSGPSIRRPPLLRRADSRFVFPDTPTEAEDLVRKQVEAGYDMIKVLAGLDREVYDRLLVVARELKVPVVGHVISEVGLERSIAAGQISFEHAYNLRPRSRLVALFGDDNERDDEAARAVARAGAWVGTIASSRDGSCEPPQEESRAIIASLRRAGVKLLAGTDAGIGPVPFGVSLHCELATLVAAGLTPYEALATATVNAGRFAQDHLRRSRLPFGTVTPGSVADLVLLATDPRSDISAIARPIGVVLKGTWRPR